MDVALVDCAALPGLWADDRLLLHALRGVATVPIVVLRRSQPACLSDIPMERAWSEAIKQAPAGEFRVHSYFGGR